MTKIISKHVMAVLMVMIIAVSMFAATAVVASADEVETIPAEGVGVTEAVIDEEEVVVPSENTDLAPLGDAAPVEEETVNETVAETAAETEAETEAETVAETTVATEAATADETKVPATTPNGKNNPKTGDNTWLFIGIGIVAIAVIAIIISVVVNKKKQANK